MRDPIAIKQRDHAHKAVAEKEGVPVYVVLTNEQLAQKLRAGVIVLGRRSLERKDRMQVKLFVVPIQNLNAAETEMNGFLRGHRVLAGTAQSVRPRVS